jgi:glycosyltransferase involved in cell wall biosynthesis
VRTKDDLLAEARRYGVEDQITIYESIPPAEVAGLVARSRTCLLLTKFEGSNRGIHEALFCDTPIIVYRHHLGMNMSYINPETGMLADDSELADALGWMVDHHAQFRPRAWAMAHTGYRFSNDLVNARLREIATARGEPWTRDIVDKVNRPNLRYKREEDRVELAPLYDRLEEALIPV